MTSLLSLNEWLQLGCAVRSLFMADGGVQPSHLRRLTQKCHCLWKNNYVSVAPERLREHPNYLYGASSPKIESKTWSETKPPDDFSGTTQGHKNGRQKAPSNENKNSKKAKVAANSLH